MRKLFALIPLDGIVHRELLPVHRPIGRCHADRVIVRPIANYGMPEYLRVTVGTAAQNERFLAALEQAIKGT